MSLQGLKVFCKLFLPLLFFVLGTSLTAYIERIFLAQYSEVALAGSLNGFALSRVFQLSSLAVAVGGQSFVGLFHGSNQPRLIGPCVWQLIWFSLASILIVTPAGFFLEHLLYHDTLLAQEEGMYFSLLCWFNFLFPLVGALSAFFIGRGKTLLVMFLTLGSCVLNIGLDYLFIFGNSYIEPMGSFGASLGKVLSIGFICLILGWSFLKSSNHEIFGTRNWSFQPLLFFQYIKPGLLRGLGIIFCFGDWVVVSRTVTLISEAHRMVYSIGVTIFFFFIFFADALLQAMLTLASTYIGQKQNDEVWKVVYYGLISMAVYSLILCIPFFIFPEILTFCFKATSFENEMLEVMHSILPSLWLALVSYGVIAIPLSLIVASRDTVYLFWVNAFIWVLSSLPIYLLMVVFGIGADKFWFLIFSINTIMAIIHFRRISKQRWLQEVWQLPLNNKLVIR